MVRLPPLTASDGLGAAPSVRPEVSVLGLKLGHGLDR